MSTNKDKLKIQNQARRLTSCRDLSAIPSSETSNKTKFMMHALTYVHRNGGIVEEDKALIMAAWLEAEVILLLLFKFAYNNDLLIIDLQLDIWKENPRCVH